MWGRGAKLLRDNQSNQGDGREVVLVYQWNRESYPVQEQSIHIECQSAIVVNLLILKCLITVIFQYYHTPSVASVLQYCCIGALLFLYHVCSCVDTTLYVSKMNKHVSNWIEIELNWSEARLHCCHWMSIHRRDGFLYIRQLRSNTKRHPSNQPA